MTTTRSDARKRRETTEPIDGDTAARADAARGLWWHCGCDPVADVPRCWYHVGYAAGWDAAMAAREATS